jgi:hypothetical protein
MKGSINWVKIQVTHDNQIKPEHKQFIRYTNMDMPFMFVEVHATELLDGDWHVEVFHRLSAPKHEFIPILARVFGKMYWHYSKDRLPEYMAREAVEVQRL